MTHERTTHHVSVNTTLKNMSDKHTAEHQRKYKGKFSYLVEEALYTQMSIDNGEYELVAKSQ